MKVYQGYKKKEIISEEQQKEYNDLVNKYFETGNEFISSMNKKI